jgi:CDGSH iron-sulfur domain-containing protein 3
MPRLVKKTATGPKKVGDKFICMCGLSKDQPFCDGSHKEALKEDKDKLYIYENDKPQEIKESTDGSCGSCSDCSCC